MISIGTGLVVAAAIAAAAAIPTAIVSSSQQSKAAKSAAGNQANQQRSLEDQLYGQRAGAESEAKATEARDLAKARQANLAVGAGGRPDTILTGPLGVAGNPSGAQKTLLGT